MPAKPKRFLTWKTILTALVCVAFLALYIWAPRPKETFPKNFGGFIVVWWLVSTFTILLHHFSSYQRGDQPKIPLDQIAEEPLSFIAIIDSVLISIGAFLFASWYEVPAVYLVVLGIASALTIVIPYLHLGIRVALQELLAFYASISLFDLVTQQVTHSKIHPGGCKCIINHEPVSRRRGCLLSLMQFPITIPMIVTLLTVKISSLIVWPLLYVGLSFDIEDTTPFGLELMRRWRSSFKALSIGLALFGIMFFCAKWFVYVQWNSLDDYLVKSSLFQMIDVPFAPLAFLPWHIASLCSSILTLVLTYALDDAIHQIHDVGRTPSELSFRLKFMRFGYRLRNILSIYSAICLVWLLTPFLSQIDFPPVNWEFLPKNNT